MSDRAKMGHTTARQRSGSATGESRLRCSLQWREDRRKVMFAYAERFRAWCGAIRERWSANLVKIMTSHPRRAKAWLQIYQKIYDICQSK